MAQVPELEDFIRLVKRVEAIEAENTFLRSILLAQRWLTRHQTMKALDVSETTLWRLTKNKTLLSIGEDSRRRYDLESVRTYLVSKKKISKNSAENRVIDALYVTETNEKPDSSNG